METVQNDIKAGLKDGLPIGLGYLATSFAFGILSNSLGLTLLEAVLISMTNLTSAGQLAAAPIIAAGGRLIELALTQLVINMRYSLMSISLSMQLDKNIGIRHRFILAFTVTDEMYAVSVGKRRPLGMKYMLSLLIFPYLGWTLGTLLGAVAGNILPAVVVSALGVAMYAMFIAIVTPAARESHPILAVVAISVALSCLFFYLPALEAVPDGFVIIICAVAASVVMSIVSPLPDDEIDASADTKDGGDTEGSEVMGDA
ncbi:MAG: AzlC family ABC transporter permease [Clostridia bacterium]|nr:AzlC family ABC transporter permease [Clostridia bacterium]